MQYDYSRTDYTRLEQLAELIKDSRFLPDYLRGASKSDILYAMIRGAELGLNPLQSLASFYEKESESMLVLNAAGMRALVLREGHKIELVSYKPEGCTLRGGREDMRGDIWYQEVAYTLEDARIEGVLGSPFWKKVPAAMCLSRATGILIRFMFADIVQGIYSLEEVTDGEPMMRESKEYFGKTVPLVPPIATKQVAQGDSTKDLAKINELLNYTIKSESFMGKNKLSPFGEWSVGSMRYALNTANVRASLSEDDIQAMESVLKYRIEAAKKEEQEITLGE